MTKLVLLALAEYAGDDGHAWPSLNTLAKACGISRATICRQLAELETGGFIKERQPDHRDNGARSSNHYWLSITTPVAESDTPCITVRLPLSQSETTPVAESDRKVNPVLEPSSQPSLEPSPPALAEPGAPVKKERKKRDSGPPDPRVTETMLRLEALQGPFAFYPRDAAIVKAMLRTAEPDEIIDCWKALKTRPIWRNVRLPLPQVADNLNEYRAGNLTAQQPIPDPYQRTGVGPPGNGPPPVDRSAMYAKPRPREGRPP